jgi:hypothetical protein
MNKFLKPFVIACLLNTLGTSYVLAQAELSKDDAKAQVIEACQAEAKARYGDDSIHYISSKVKWMKAMGGASVKMKLKPESKRVVKYSCVLQTDSLIKFYKS